MENDRVKSYIRNYKEANDNKPILVFDVNGDDVLKLMEQDPDTDSWDVNYYLKVQSVIKKIDKLFPY
jgi:hypothetical protein